MNEDEEEEAVDLGSLNIAESNSNAAYELPSTPFEEVPRGTVDVAQTQNEEEAALRELEAEMAA